MTDKEHELAMEKEETKRKIIHSVLWIVFWIAFFTAAILTK